MRHYNNHDNQNQFIANSGSQNLNATTKPKKQNNHFSNLMYYNNQARNLNLFNNQG